MINSYVPAVNPSSPRQNSAGQCVRVIILDRSGRLRYSSSVSTSATGVDIADVIDRAHQLARERDQLAQLAVAEERSRIAREIHDIVAHSVSVMIALSEGGARAVDNAPDEAVNAMQRSAETGRTALTEMRRLLGALQMSDAADMAPQPGLTDIPALGAGFQEAGLTCLVEGDGSSSMTGSRGSRFSAQFRRGSRTSSAMPGVGATADVTLRRTDAASRSPCATMAGRKHDRPDDGDRLWPRARGPCRARARVRRPD